MTKIKLSILIILYLWVATLFGQNYKVGDLITNDDGSIGVVFWVHPDGSGGWMVALRDDGNAPMADGNTIPTLPSPLNIYSDMNGYDNTQRIRAYQNNDPTYGAGLVHFNNGWYIPACGQLHILMGSLPDIQDIITANNGVGLSAVGNYWSSSQSAPSDFACLSYIYGGNYSNDRNYNIRAIKDFTNFSANYDNTLSYQWSTGATDPYITVSPTQTTTYTITAASSVGCGASASQTIIVNNASGQTITDSICAGETYTKYGFNETSAGIYNQNVTQNACTANITLDLKVNPAYASTFQDNICLGNSYTANKLNITPTQTGNFTQTFYYSSIKGCDSTVTVKLDVLPSYKTNLYDTICVNSSYTKDGFSLPVQNIAGMHTYTRTLIARQGCDSVIVLNLLVNKKIENIISDQVCPNTTYNRYNFSIPPQPLGTTVTRTQNLISQIGCDSIVVLNLSVTQLIQKTINKDICEGGSYYFKGKNINVAGVYKDTLVAVGGCDSIVTLNLNLHKPDKTDLYDTININNAYNKNGFNLPVQNAMGNIHKTLILKNTYGCDSVVNLRLYVYDPSFKPPCDVKLSTILDPASKANNMFGIYNFANNLPLTDCLGKYTITIFNRYGQKITVTGTEGWNGKVKGELADAGVYYYVLEYASGSEKKQMKGTIEVIKK